MAWLSEHRDLITTLTAIGTLLVWVVYLQVFVSSYRRQLRATLLITRGAGEEIDAQCFLSNMSSGPVFVQSVIITLDTGDETLVRPVTDRHDLDGQAALEPRRQTRQGPLAPGEIMGIGSFRALIWHAIDGAAEHQEADRILAKSIVIEILGVYGSEDLPVGARRKFDIRVENGGTMKIRGASIGTSQIRTRRERKRLIAEIDRDR